MRLIRPKIGVGTKTWLALTMVFWLPVIIMAGMFFYLFQGLLYEEVLGSMKVNLKGAKGVYEERVRIIEGVTAQFSSRPDVEARFFKKESSALQTELINFGRQNPYLDILIAVDESQKVIARRNDKRGDIINIGNTLTKALSSGEAAGSTEIIGAEFMSREDESFTARAKDLGGIGVAQVVVSPVVHNGKAVGAVVAGTLLTGDAWLGNTVYNRFGAEMAIFAGESTESLFLHATASLPRATWVMRQLIPAGVKNEIALGKHFYGTVDVAGTEQFVAYEPLLDGRDRIIGAIGVSQPAKSINLITLKTIAKGVAAAAGVGFVLSIIVTVFITTDITRPLGFLVNAMEKFGKGEIDISVDLKTGDQFEKLGEGFNIMASGIRKREERLRKHNEVAKHLMSTLDLRELLERILNIAVSVTESQMGVIYLSEADRTMLVPHVIYGTKAKLETLAMGEGYPGKAAADNKTFIINPAQGQTAEVLELGFAQSPPVEAAYVPLCYQSNVLGVLVLGSVKKYTDEEKTLFDYLAGQISIALDNAIMHQKIQELSITDGLTGLYNRRYLNNRLDEEWSRSLRNNQPISMLLFDVDNFKSVNDTYGHDKGDEVLKAIGKVLRANTRKEDMAARYGGEEFVILLIGTGGEDARVMAEKTRSLIKGQVHEWMGRSATVSIGVATFPGIKAAKYEDLVQAADQAMYKAKVSGKDRVVVFGT